MKDHDNGYDNKSGDRIRRCIGSGMLRLDELKKHLAASDNGDRRAFTRLIDDIQAITRELEKGFGELQEASERCSKAQAAAAHAEQQADFLIEQSPLAFLILDREATIVRANAAASRALNLSQSHLLGKSFLLFINGERQRFLAQLGEVATGQPAAEWTIGVRPRDRGLVPMTVVATPQSAEQVMLLLQPAGMASHETPGSAPVRDVAAATWRPTIRLSS